MHNKHAHHPPEQIAPLYWTMFLLEIRRDLLEWQSRLAAFSKGYGEDERGSDAAFCQALYQGMHVGAAAVWSQVHVITDDLDRTRRDLDTIADRLTGFLVQSG